MFTQKQIRARIKSLTEHSRNRLYKSDLLEKEVDENLLYLMAVCKRFDKDVDKTLLLVIKRMKEMPNMSFTEAVVDVLGVWRRVRNFTYPVMFMEKTIINRRINF